MMSDPQTPTLAARACGPGTSRGVKIALALSVALNLAVAGLAVGAWLSDDGPRRGMPRDLGFGPFSEALDPKTAVPCAGPSWTAGARFPQQRIPRPGPSSTPCLPPCARRSLDPRR
jgi:hypothetical protein